MKKIIALIILIPVIFIIGCTQEPSEKPPEESKVLYSELQKGKYMNQGMSLQIYHPLIWKLEVGTGAYARYNVPEMEDQIVIFIELLEGDKTFDTWISDRLGKSPDELKTWTYTSKLEQEIEVKENEKGNEYYILRENDVIVLQNGTDFYEEDYLIPKEDFDEFVKSYDYIKF